MAIFCSIDNQHMDPLFRVAEADKLMCADCMKCFKLKSSLKRHRRDVHGDSPVYISREIFQEDTHKDKPFECTACSRKFTRKYDLERHILHTGCRGNVRPSYSCQACKRVFSRKDNLQEHSKLCCERFVKKSKKKFKCQRCNKELQTVTLLKIHLRTHSGNRRHVNK